MILKSLNATILINNQKLSVANAVEKVIQSYAECLKNCKAEIDLPLLTELNYRNYE